MTPLGALLAGLVLSQPALGGSATKPGAARVVSGPAWLAAGAAIPYGQRFAIGPSERVELLTSGRCLVRLSPGSVFRLDQPAPGARCPTLRLEAGAAGFLAERSPGSRVAMTLALRGASVVLGHGVGTLHASPSVSTKTSTTVDTTLSTRSSRLCLEHGLARVFPGPVASVMSAPPGATGSSAPVAPAAAAAPTAPVAPIWVKAGQCLGLSSAAPATVPYTEEEAAEDRARCHVAPEIRLPAALLAAFGATELAQELARLKARGPGGERGGTEVEGGGQSMCLETGGEGGAGDVGTGGTVEIVKPPPPTRLNLRVVIRR